MMKRKKSGPPVVADPAVMSGAPCFAGTRVPVSIFFDYLRAGHSFEFFLEGFPTVSRKQVLAVLAESARTLQKRAA